MHSYSRLYWATRATAATMALLALLLAAPTAEAKNLSKKKWRVTVTAPGSPSGNSFGTQSFLIRARVYEEPPSPLPIRKLTATTADGSQDLQGVWRQSGKTFSLTFELLCESGNTCGSIILRGRFPSKKTMAGQAIIVWDREDRDNPARFETVNGAFEGTRE